MRCGVVGDPIWVSYLYGTAWGKKVGCGRIRALPYTTGRRGQPVGCWRGRKVEERCQKGLKNWRKGRLQCRVCLQQSKVCNQGLFDERCRRNSRVRVSVCRTHLRSSTSASSLTCTASGSKQPQAEVADVVCRLSVFYAFFSPLTPLFKGEGGTASSNEWHPAQEIKTEQMSPGKKKEKRKEKKRGA